MTASRLFRKIALPEVICIAALFAAFFGCAETPPSAKASQYIGGWKEMAPQLPDKQQIGFFRTHFASVKPQVWEALSHPDIAVRMRAAYVIGEIGTPARSLAPALLARLQNESDELVRIYIINALGAIRSDDPSTLKALSQRFEMLNSENVPPSPDYSYAEVDEKINIAAAMFVLTEDSSARVSYFNFVTQWLKPPPEGLSEDLNEGYWERRWVAVNSLGRMRGATEAIPLLEGLAKEEGAKPWVHVQVTRAIDELRKSGQKQPENSSVK